MTNSPTSAKLTPSKVIALSEMSFKHFSIAKSISMEGYRASTSKLPTGNCMFNMVIHQINKYIYIYDVRLDGKTTASENKYLMLILQTCFGRSRPQCVYIYIYIYIHIYIRGILRGHH